MGDNVHMDIPAVASMGNDLATCATQLDPASTGLASAGALGADAAGTLPSAGRLAASADGANAAVATFGATLADVLAIDSEYVILAAAQVKEAYGE
ncbi:hypothetical protein GCM10022261_00010 [Brevibacterium daeguense]|uniref:Excreted virulence factor EspC (Type VII ESX diderm) n=1 Tax=Brevibacterium daeguense TaxID=909936 RepID=A0ABP8EF38_9MICO|nr:hypothetical protein [Brevibacterium daeguense]